MRVEDKTNRITWEDEIKLEVVRKGRFGKATEKMEDRKVLATLEYILNKEKNRMTSLTLSVEKSEVDNITMVQLRNELIKIAAQRLSSIHTNFSEGEWQSRLEDNLNIKITQKSK